jgi:hypothetical protein
MRKVKRGPLSITRVSRREFGTARQSSLMDDGDDEHAALAQVVDEAPGVGGDLADVRVVELGHDATDERRLLERIGLAPHLADDVLGVDR